MKKPFEIVGARVCKRCGVTFEYNAKQLNKQYCDGCRDIHRYESMHSGEALKRRREYMRWYNSTVKKARYKPVRHKATCVRCGREFILGSGRPTKICIDCLINSTDYAERQRGYARRDYTTNK